MKKMSSADIVSEPLVRSNSFLKRLMGKGSRKRIIPFNKKRRPSTSPSQFRRTDDIYFGGDYVDPDVSYEPRKYSGISKRDFDFDDLMFKFTPELVQKGVTGRQGRRKLSRRRRSRRRSRRSRHSRR